MIHNNFFAVPIDKARGNITFFRQRRQAEALINKIGPNNFNNATSTYMKAIKPVDKILPDNTLSLKN